MLKKSTQSPTRIEIFSEFGVTYSEKHRSNETLAHQDLPKVIILHAKKEREELG